MTPPRRTDFYFVRHGLTDHTGHRLTGWMEGVHLNREGLEQAESVAERLSRTPFKAVYASPIERTRETAAPIARKQDLRVITRRGLGEVDYGKWTNRYLKSLVRTKLWSSLHRWPSGARFPEGETLRETQARALDEIERIRAEHPSGNVCCVSHADVIKLVVAHYAGVHIDLFQRISIDPASTSVLSLSDVGPRIVSVNIPSV